MKRNYILIVLILAVAGVAAWLLTRSDPTDPGAATAATTNTAARALSPQPTNSIINPSIPSVPAAKAEELTEEAWKRVQAMHKMSLTMNGPIAFYARVLDQHGQPVPAAQLTVSVSSYSASGLSRLKEAWRGKYGPEQHREMLAMTSNSDGIASVSNKTGTRLRVENVEREGYLLPEPVYGSFTYEPQNSPLGRPHANPANPMVIRLWKQGESAPWFGLTRVYSYGEREADRFRLNLFNADTRNVAEQADLIVETVALDTRPDAGGWLVEYKLTAPTGGIQLTSDPIPYLAPAEGYQPFWSIRSRGQAMSDGPPKVFYMKSRNGQVFASFKFRVEGGKLEFEGRVNPNGSRLLEPDPAKAIGDPDEIRRLDELTAQR